MKVAESLVALVALGALVARGVRDTSNEFAEALTKDGAEAVAKRREDQAEAVQVDPTEAQCKAGGEELLSIYKNFHKTAVKACWIAGRCIYLPTSTDDIWENGMPEPDTSKMNAFTVPFTFQEECSEKDGDVMACMCASIPGAVPSTKKADCKCPRKDAKGRKQQLFCGMDPAIDQQKSRRFAPAMLPDNRKFFMEDAQRGYVTCYDKLYCSAEADSSQSEIQFGKDTPLYTDKAEAEETCSGIIQPAA